MMLRVTILFSLTCICLATNAGLQMRLTEKGMKYATDVGIGKLQKDLQNKRIRQSGSSGKTSFNFDMTITHASFPVHQLVPESGVGIHAKISGIEIDGKGEVRYRYKRGWFKISDKVPFKIWTRNIHADLTISIGADKKGQPTIGMRSCDAGVSSVSVKFYGSKGFIYNMFKGKVGRMLKSKIGKLICENARKEIDIRAKSELKTFPVVKKIDKFAEIDYSLVKPPSFTSQYMDIFLKGEFKPINKKLNTNLQPPHLSPSPIYNKMVYFWVSKYTLDTAAEVYFKGGFFKSSFQSWDKKVSQKLKKHLNTAAFSIIIPKLENVLPKLPMGIEIYAYKAPSVDITPGGVKIKLYTHAMFTALSSKNKIKTLFGAKLDLYADVDVTTNGDNLSGTMKSFTYDAKVEKIYLPGFTAKDIPLNNQLTKLILSMTVIDVANPFLKKGFPLPQLGDVAFKNFDIKLMQNAIRIGTDVKYVKH